MAGRVPGAKGAAGASNKTQPIGCLHLPDQSELGMIN